MELGGTVNIYNGIVEVRGSIPLGSTKFPSESPPASGHRKMRGGWRIADDPPLK